MYNFYSLRHYHIDFGHSAPHCLMQCLMFTLACSHFTLIQYKSPPNNGKTIIGVTLALTAFLTLSINRHFTASNHVITRWPINIIQPLHPPLHLIDSPRQQPHEHDQLPCHDTS